MVSFKSKAGVKASQGFDGFPLSHDTPIFTIDYSREVVAANKCVHKDTGCLPNIGSPISPVLESQQKGDASAGGGASLVTRCNEELIPDGSVCCLEAEEFIDSIAQIKSTGSDMLPTDGSCTRPMDPAEMLEQGVPLECPLEALNSADIGCHRDSTNSDPIDVVDAHNLDAKVLGPNAGPADRVCVHRHGIHSGGFSQHHEHDQFALPPLASVVDGASMGSKVGMNHQSPHRIVNNVPRPDAQLDLSVECGDKHKGLTWSSVVSKNTLGGHDYMGVVQSS